MSNSSTEIVSALSQSLADAVERIGPSLVLVDGRARRPASGVVVGDDLVLTADHVLEREDDLKIQTHDGRTLAAQFVGRDPVSDLAVLRVPSLGLPVAPQVKDPARVGQIILAVGRPSSSGPMASLGVVSAVSGPVRTRRGTIEQIIQTDATPYPGFSGGVLLTAQGEVAGIFTSGMGGAALSIPVAQAQRVVDAITQHGSVKRGFLGIGSQPVRLPAAQRSARSQDHGLLIVTVEESSPADQGGIIVGDIVVGFAGTQVQDTDDLHALLSGNHVGAAVPVEILRGGSLQTLQVTVGERK